jgi:hypothetical protein
MRGSRAPVPPERKGHCGQDVGAVLIAEGCPCLRVRSHLVLHSLDAMPKIGSKLIN